MPGYSTSATAKDPDPITSAQLTAAGVTESAYSLFIPVGLAAGHFSPEGEITMDVSYDTASGSLSLLHIDLDAQHVILTGDSNALYYLDDALTEGPTEISSDLKTLTQLQTILGQDVQNDTIVTPLYLGIDLEGIPVPTVDMADGSVASIHVDTGVFDAAGVPEPSTVTLIFACGVAGIVFGRRQHCRQHRSYPA